MNCIVQYFMAPQTFSQPKFNNLGLNEELLEYSKLSAQKYAEKIGCDYVLIDTPTINHRHPTFERFDLWYNSIWWKKYTHVLYIDTDVICWPEAPDIFQMYPDTVSFKPCDDPLAKKRSIQHHQNTSKNTCLEKYDPKILQQKRFNAGVFMLNSQCVEKMKPYIDLNDPSDDNQMLIDIMLKSQVQTTYMDSRFNKKMGVSSWFGHAFGQSKLESDNKVLSRCRSLYHL